jgi:hypothetical protein
LRGYKQTHQKFLPAIAKRSGQAGGRNPKSEFKNLFHPPSAFWHLSSVDRHL